MPRHGPPATSSRSTASLTSSSEQSALGSADDIWFAPAGRSQSRMSPSVACLELGVRGAVMSPSHLAAAESIDDEDHPDPAAQGWDASEVKDCKPRVSLRDNTAYKRFKKTQKKVM